MIKLKRESKLSFFGCNFGQTIGRGSSDSRRIKSDQRILGKTIAPIQERASEFLREQKEGCNPLALRPGASSIRRIGITCYTSLDFNPSSTFLFAFLWHTKSSGFTLKRGSLYSPYFGKTWTSIYSIFEVKMELYT